tara:strand:+ start:80 stop:247 length:168 start_codon:yes stop_codon:yes gene_type:complete
LIIKDVIAENENKIIKNLIRLHQIKVEDIMTFRPVVSKLEDSRLHLDQAKTSVSK